MSGKRKPVSLDLLNFRLEKLHIKALNLEKEKKELRESIIDCEEITYKSPVYDSLLECCQMDSWDLHFRMARIDMKYAIKDRDRRLGRV